MHCYLESIFNVELVALLSCFVLYKFHQVLKSVLMNKQCYQYASFKYLLQYW